MISTDYAGEERYVTPSWNVGMVHLWATLSSVLNNRRIAALTCATATAVAALAVPSAGAATVGAPNEGVCSLKVNDAEREYIDTLDRNVGLGASDERERWSRAFEQTFPGASSIAAEFRDLFTGSYVSVFNSNHEENIERWAQRISAETGADLKASSDYFTEVWGSAASSDHAGFNMSVYWNTLDQALASGTITVPTRDGFEEFRTVPNREELLAQRAEKFPDMPNDQLAKWVDAYDSLPDVKQARRVAALMVAFEDARKTCALGGGTALLPTDGPNPDASKVQKTPTAPVPPAREGNSRETVTHTITNGNVSTTVTSDSTSVTNLSVSATVQKANAPQPASGGSSASPGVVIGVIVAFLVALGAAGAAFALMG